MRWVRSSTIELRGGGVFLRWLTAVGLTSIVLPCSPDADGTEASSPSTGSNELDVRFAKDETVLETVLLIFCTDCFVFLVAF